MRCFDGGPRRRDRESPTPPPPPANKTETEDDDGGGNGRKRRQHQSPMSSTAQTPTVSTATSPGATINLGDEYTLAVQTNSYNEIWAKIHSGDGPATENEDVAPPSAALSPARLIARVLQPDRASIQEVLCTAPPSHLTRLVSSYFDSSESTSAACLSLRRAVDHARPLYDPISKLLELLPCTSPSPTSAGTGPGPHLTPAQCDWAFDTFFEFDRLDNPFPAPSTGFQGMRRCFSELRQQLESHLRKARRRRRLLRRATRGAAACLIGAAAGAAVAALVIATHALAALVAGPAVCLLPGDLLAGPRRRAREHMAQLDAAARGTYVLNNDLDTIERLVARLHETVESDKKLVRLGLERGRGMRHPIEEVLRQLHKNHPCFLHQLEDLDEHICLFFAAVNRARSLLLRQIHHHHHHRHSG
ncbi:UPF0496 protein At3g19330-like [Phoenix dactylifera]|uniref:UPF0496 protein At3g19330-like n=1 Tax=Phoenix dactylifera TaxID=42345 RepID=A0A8B8ZKG5_PHODC|nr:UPF0496 protein At3g19330-like [Phoenix dactylifera]XP_038971959.1 UPF0496 protein At3g19330-like [Phoenix dactylifera]